MRWALGPPPACAAPCTSGGGPAFVVAGRSPNDSHRPRLLSDQTNCGAVWFPNPHRKLPQAHSASVAPPRCGLQCKSGATSGKQLWVSIRVTRKIRVEYFGFREFRVLKSVTRNLPEIMKTRHFGYPEIRVRVTLNYPKFVRLHGERREARW